MNECGWFSSRISALMHLLRAGVCGFLVTLAVKDSHNDTLPLSSEEMEIVRSVQHGRVTNLLAPYVKRLRDMNARKPRTKDNTVNANGDITSGAYTFPKTVWSTIIPRLVEYSKTLFKEILDGNWEIFLTHPVMVADWTNLDCYVRSDEAQVFLKNLVVHEVAPNNQAIFYKLQAIAEFCLFGLGVGAVRFEEVSRLTLRLCQWHNGCIYFWTESLKKGSFRGRSSPRLVEHKLPQSISRLFLLLRKALLCLERNQPESLLPKTSETGMLHLVRDIFIFDHAPSMLNVRHLFTSIGNILLPETDDSILVSTQI